VDITETIILLTGKVKVISFLIIATYGKDRHKQQEHMNKSVKTLDFALYLVWNFSFLFYQLDFLFIIHSFYGPNYDGFNQTQKCILQWCRVLI